MIKYSGGSSPTIVQSSTMTSYTKSSTLAQQGEIFATVGTGGVNFHGWKGKVFLYNIPKYLSSDATFGILEYDGSSIIRLTKLGWKIHQQRRFREGIRLPLLKHFLTPSLR